MAGKSVSSADGFIYFYVVLSFVTGIGPCALICLGSPCQRTALSLVPWVPPTFCLTRSLIGLGLCQLGQQAD